MCANLAVIRVIRYVQSGVVNGQQHLGGD
jgi:hypothetical protein